MTTALILGVANSRSIGWHCVQSLLQTHQNIIITYHNPRFETNINKLLHSFQETSNGNHERSIKAIPCDVSEEENILKLFANDIPSILDNTNDGKIGTIVHSIAYAPSDAMKGTSLLQTSKKAFDMTHDTSSYSFLSVARNAFPLLGPSSSLIALSYLGAVRAVPNYNIMGPAKASLESIIRGLAYDLGHHGIRVNGVSSGPINTMSAKGITGFTSMKAEAAAKSCLRRDVVPREVADSIAFLASDAASGITGQILYVDCGYNVVAA